MCDIEYDDDYTLWREEDRRARKPHQCAECRRAIQPGALYLSHFSIHSGGRISGAICEECRDDRAAFAGEHEGITPSLGELLWMLEECIVSDDEAGARWRPMLERLRNRTEVPR